MKIYLVTNGSYSEYSVIGPYSTKEKALEAQDYYASANEIEEYELDAPIPEHPPGTCLYYVSIKRDGEVIRCYPTDGDNAEIRWYPVQSHIYADGTRVPFGARDAPTAYFFFHVWAKDEATAIKVANERRLACIADGRWTGVFRQDCTRLE